MRAPVSIAAIGCAAVRDDRPAESAPFERRLAEALAAATPGTRPVRLIHRIEEAAFLAARDAFAPAGDASGAATGIALGLDEGIDGIKARHLAAVRDEGPLGASPLHFPFTAPNAVAAQVGIGLGLRGESVTYCGGALSGAHAIVHARETLDARRQDFMLAGAATWVEREFLDGLARAGKPGSVPGAAACVLLLRRAPAAGRGAGPLLLGAGCAFGPDDVADAVGQALEEAGLSAARLGGARLAAAPDPRAALEALRNAGVPAPRELSPWSGVHAASFPLAVAEALGISRPAPGAPILVVAADCLGGAAAAVVGGGPGSGGGTEVP